MIHEIKLDGYRIGCALEEGEVRLLSRRNLEWTAEFPTVVSAAKRLRLDSALLDGEVAAVLPDGRTSFHAMQTRSLGGANLAYFIFDIVHLDGEDLLALPVEQRKERLRGLLGAKPPAPLRYVDHMIGGGADFFAAASRMRLEGMISKSRTEPYRPGARHRSWQKTKCQLRQEFVVGGWQPSVTGGLGSMILGYYDDKGHLTYAGKVGTGHQRQEKDCSLDSRASGVRRLRSTPLFLARCCETLDGWSRSWSPRSRSSSGRATVCGIRAFRGCERTRILVTFGLKDPSFPYANSTPTLTPSPSAMRTRVTRVTFNEPASIFASWVGPSTSPQPPAPASSLAPDGAS